MADSQTLTNLILELRAREAVGRNKYGTDVDRTDLTNANWRQHLREELMDALLYSLAEERTASHVGETWPLGAEAYSAATVAMRQTLRDQKIWITMETTYAALDALKIIPGWRESESQELPHD